MLQVSIHLRRLIHHTIKTCLTVIVIVIVIVNQSILPLWTFPLRMKIVKGAEITSLHNGCRCHLYSLESISCIELKDNMHHRHIFVSPTFRSYCYWFWKATYTRPSTLDNFSVFLKVDVRSHDDKHLKSGEIERGISIHTLVTFWLFWGWMQLMIPYFIISLKF